MFFMFLCMPIRLGSLFTSLFVIVSWQRLFRKWIKATGISVTLLPPRSSRSISLNWDRQRGFTEVILFIWSNSCLKFGRNLKKFGISVSWLPLRFRYVREPRSTSSLVIESSKKAWNLFLSRSTVWRFLSFKNDLGRLEIPHSWSLKDFKWMRFPNSSGIGWSPSLFWERSSTCKFGCFYQILGEISTMF